MVRVPRWGWVVLLGIVLAGCGDSNVFEGLSDDSSDQGRLERGVEALNQGAWDEAIALLEGLDADDPDVRKYLASAYVGRAGFDTLGLVNEIVAAQDAGGGGTVLYGAAVWLFGDADGDGFVSSDDLRSKESDVNRAVELLAPGGLARPEDAFQAGVYAALHAVVLVADTLDRPDVSQEAVASMDDGEIDAAVSDEAFLRVQAGLERDLWLVLDGVDAVADNDLSEDFAGFLSQLGFDDRVIAADEVRAFLKGM